MRPAYLARLVESFGVDFPRIAPPGESFPLQSEWDTEHQAAYLELVVLESQRVSPPAGSAATEAASKQGHLDEEEFEEGWQDSIVWEPIVDECEEEAEEEEELDYLVDFDAEE
jgi:hypothetical protein